MQFSAQSEWMEDQKQATVMGPGQDFKVVQTPSGASIFFSIGSDGIFYITREVQATSTGWNRIDLSTELAANHNGTKVEAKSFCVTQNVQDLSFDLALVITVDHSDYLYVSYGNANRDEAWFSDNSELKLKWTALPFDAAAGGNRKIEIADVYLVSLPQPQATFGRQVCFADVLKGNSDSNKLRLLDRYYVTPNDNVRWKLQTLPIDLAAGSISSCLGCRAKDKISGMYTFGTIESRTQLIYTPAFDYWDPSVPPSPARFTVPEGATTIASAINSAGRSNLFVSAKDGIFVFPPDAQKDGSAGIRIISTDLVSQAAQLTAGTYAGTTALYGANRNGDLFYSTCPTGSESQTSAWSYPIPIVSNIERYSFYLNNTTANNVVFAHIKGEQVTQLTQDVVTKDWAARPIMLPSTDMDHVLTYSSFRTRLVARTDSGSPVSAGTKIKLTATSSVGVFIEGSYRVLSPSIPITAPLDATGSLVIVQPTEDSVAICYTVTSADDANTTLSIDPGNKIKDRWASLQTKAGLDNAKVTLADGSVVPLISSDVSNDEREAAAAVLKQLVSVHETLPQNGAPSKAQAAAQDQPVQQQLSVKVEGGSRLQLAQPDNLLDEVKHILVNAGDFFRSILHSAWNAVKDFAVRVVNGIHEVVVKIGETIYRAVLDCVAAVGHAVEWVFTKLKVAFDAVKNFLGFLFNWKSIVRTHKVLKNVVYRYSLDSLSRISNIKNFVETEINSLEQKLHDWAELPDRDTTLGKISGDSSASYDDPQSHYISDKVKSNIDNAQTSASAKDGEGSGWSGVLDEIKNYAGEQKETVAKVIDRIKEDIIKDFSSLTPVQLVKRLLGIIGDLVLETAKKLVVTTLGLIQDLGRAVIEELNEPIQIPIVSTLYKSIADEELSILDLVCLVAAVPSTIIFKAITGEEPFKDDSTTNNLISAADFPAIQKIMTDQPSTFKVFTVVGECVAMSGLLLSGILGVCKTPWMLKGEAAEVPDILKQITIPTKVLIILPNLIRPRHDNDPWEDKMDAVITNLAFLKTCVDATTIGEKEMYGEISPYIDYSISALWIAPSIGRVITNHSKSSHYTSMSTSLAYDVAIMTTPLCWSSSVDPETKLAVFAGSAVVLGICSALRVTTAGLVQDDD